MAGSIVTWVGNLVLIKTQLASAMQLTCSAIDELHLSTKTITRSYSSNGNQGQKFSGTGPGNKIKLDYIPYVEDKFNNAVYNNNYGSVNITNNIGYSPVTVTLEDGTVAINLTNYINEMMRSLGSKITTSNFPGNP